MIDSLAASPDCKHLIVAWENGATTQISAEILRREARDAHSTRARIDFGEVPVAPDIAITALSQVGRMGINVHFSDGHDRAIYPFAYLEELSELYGN